MELLALVLINIAFGIILYFAVSIKVTNSVRDYQIVKLRKEIQAHTLTFFKESESYLALMDSRIAVLKNLLHKAENLGINFQDSQELEKDFSKKTAQKAEEFKKASLPSTSVDSEISGESYKKNTPKSPTAPPRQVQKEQVNEDGMLTGFFTGLGKGLKSMFGVEDEIFLNQEREPVSKTKKNSVIDVSIGGNPLDSDEVLRDNLTADSTFQTILNRTNNPYSQTPKPTDSVQISMATVLEELPPDATKVEKVVHLLKKGYSHLDISEEMNLAIPEISLIETIKIERSRRA